MRVGARNRTPGNPRVAALGALAPTTGARACFPLRTRLHNPSEPGQEKPSRCPRAFYSLELSTASEH